MASLSDDNRVVDTLVQKIYENFRGFNISEIIKGGSLGHGTPVFSNHDVDLVVYSRDFKADDLRRAEKENPSCGYKQWLEKLKEFLSRNYPDINLKIEGRSVKFTFKEIHVDLLVSPYWRDQHELFRYLSHIPVNERQLFTVSTSKWQVLFFKKQPPQVKEYIRKAKEWRNKNWPEGNRRPSSYLMSLLVVAAWEQSHKHAHTDAYTVTQTIKDLVKRPRLDIYWETFYEKSEYPLPSRPRVVDPANPFNNVWRSGTGLESYIDTIRF